MRLVNVALIVSILINLQLLYRCGKPYVFEKRLERKRLALRKYRRNNGTADFETTTVHIKAKPKQNTEKNVYQSANLFDNSPCVNLPVPCKKFKVQWPKLAKRNLPLGAHLCDDGEVGLTYQRYLERAAVHLRAGQNKSKAPLIFINMPAAQDRQNYIVDHFKHTFERIVHFPAINTSSSLWKKLKLIAPAVNNKILAVLLSHLEAIKVARQEILREKSPPYAFIVEDDAEQSFRPFWKSKSLDELVSRLPSGWQVAQLGMSRFRFSPGPVPYYDKELYVKIDQHFAKTSEWGAFAYIISKEGIERMLKTNLTLLSSTCRPMTADDCLLGFKPGGRSTSPFKKKHQYIVTPAMFGINRKHAHTGHRQGGNKEWHSNAANAGQCTSLYENVISYNH